MQPSTSAPIDDPLTRELIGAAIEVHRVLGPGLLESAYETCLAWELASRGLEVDRQVVLPLRYKEVAFDAGYRVDLIVAHSVIVDVKATEKLSPIASAQVLTYMKLSGIQTGLVINFHVELLKDGVRRLRL